MTGRHKYSAKRTTVEGHTFDSKAEAERYCELRLLEQSGAIEELTLQPKYALYGEEGELICHYVADFEYVKRGENQVTIEDVKGAETPVFRLKKKWFETDYAPRKITIVKIKKRQFIK
jgi:dsDNA-binding SOS-regulon protein